MSFLEDNSLLQRQKTLAHKGTNIHFFHSLTIENLKKLRAEKHSLNIVKTHLRMFKIRDIMNFVIKTKLRSRIYFFLKICIYMYAYTCTCVLFKIIFVSRFISIIKKIRVYCKVVVYKAII